MNTKLFLTTALLLLAAQCCSDPNTRQESSLKEQAHFAGAIIEGTVKSLVDWNNTEAIVVTVAKYHKGCGASEVIIRGFIGNIKCGISAPSVNTKALFFVCADEAKEEWRLNAYTDFAGSLNADATNIASLLEATEDAYKCFKGTFMYASCKKRSDPAINKYLPRVIPSKSTPFAISNAQTDSSQESGKLPLSSIWNTASVQQSQGYQSFSSFGGQQADDSAARYGFPSNAPFVYNNVAQAKPRDAKFNPFDN